MAGRSRSTSLIHHPYQPPSGFEAPQAGVFKASTVIFPNVAALRARQWKDKTGYTYGLHGTPTTFTLEERIATLEGGTQTLLLPSGLAAITLVNLALLDSGDELLIPSNAYGPSREQAQHELSRWGITHRLYDPMDPDALEALVTPRTKLLWVEAPGSVTMEFPELPALVQVARRHGLVVALDNTWGAGLAFCGFDLGDGTGADIVMQALTKYPSGGGDVLMGSVTTRDPGLHLALKRLHMRTGFGVGANDVEAVLRSLPSMALRYAAQDRAARELAQWLGGQPQVARVLHPALPGSPGHEHWQRLCTQAAGLFSIVFEGGAAQAQVDAFVDALTLFRIGYSWGGSTSLVVPYDLRLLRHQAEPGWLVRFSIGLEDVEDLRADLAQALASAFA